MNGQASYSIDFNEALTRLVKYALEGAVVAFAAYAIPSIKLDFGEIITIALVAACTLAIIDFVAPSYSSSLRFGIGAGMGANLAGFPGRQAPPGQRR